MQSYGCCSIVGTAGIHEMAMDEPNIEPKMVGMTLCHGPEDRWLRMMAAMTATPNLDWFLENFASADKEEAKKQGKDLFAYFDEMVAGVPLGANGLIFHPYLAPGGERAPFVKPNAKGSFFGLSLNHTRHHLLRAVYEGVGFAMLDCYKHMPMEIKEIRLSGGGAKSPVWCQIFADMTGVPIKVPAGTEFGAKGAAMAAGIAAGVYKDYAEAVEKTVRLVREYQLNQENTQKYARLYELYKGYYQAVMPLWEQRAEILASLGK